jgi:hypothetical protein
MHPSVCLILPDQTRTSLYHGDLIGRIWSAALVVDDPRVSEGHAMISLRGGELWILALRRRIAIDGKSVSEARLRASQVIELADKLALTVESVELPESVFAVEADGLPAVAIPAVASIKGRPRPVILPQHDPAAPCLLWTTGEGWKRSLEGIVSMVEPGDSWRVEGIEFRALLLNFSGSTPTRLTGGVDPPLKLMVDFDSAQLQRGTDPPVLLAGISARILSELVALGGAASWDIVAKEIWPDENDEPTLRRRWDVAMIRLRNRLKEAKIRPTLIRAAGTGLVELVLHLGDTVEDRS